MQLFVLTYKLLTLTYMNCPVSTNIVAGGSGDEERTASGLMFEGSAVEHDASVLLVDFLLGTTPVWTVHDDELVGNFCRSSLCA